MTAKIRDSSLHLLVKDEIVLLPKLLKYVSPWVEEIVVVDTCSTDGTLEVAQQFTDNVFQMPLSHDFGAARNFALSKVTKEWVFHLDADEWPTEVLLIWLMDFVGSRKSTQYEGVSIHRHNTIDREGIGDRTHEWHTRFFRRMYKFEGCIHEMVNAPVEWMIRAPYAAVIEHFKRVSRQEKQNAFYEEWCGVNC